MIKLRYVVFMFFALWITVPVIAQGSTTPTQCGAIVESEFTDDVQQHKYILTMAPGDKIQANATPLGDVLKVAIGIYAPNGDMIGVGGDQVTWNGPAFGPSINPSAETGILSARGDYVIIVANTAIHSGGSIPDAYRGGIGVYTLYIGCTLRDGTVIAPGDVPLEQNTVPETAPSIPATTCEGLCFPGLPPTDLNNIARLPLIPDTPMTAALTPTGSEIYGFTLDATAEQVMTLTLNRISGNLNIAIVALTPDNRVAQALILTTTATLTTDLTFTMTGQYTFAVFRVDLLPPADPQATVLQVTGMMNP